MQEQEPGRAGIHPLRRQAALPGARVHEHCLAHVHGPVGCFYPISIGVQRRKLSGCVYSDVFGWLNHAISSILEGLQSLICFLVGASTDREDEMHEFWRWGYLR